MIKRVFGFAVVVALLSGGWLVAQTIVDVHPNKVEILSSATDALKLTNGGGIQASGFTAGPIGLQWNGSSGGSFHALEPASNSIRVQVRPNAGGDGYITWTENTIADRWALGIENGDGNLYLRTGDMSGTLHSFFHNGGFTLSNARGFYVRNTANTPIPVGEVTAANQLNIGTDAAGDLVNTVLAAGGTIQFRTAGAARWNLDSTGFVPVGTANVGSAAAPVSTFFGNALGFTSNTGIYWRSGTSSIELDFGGVRKYQITANQFLIEDNAAVSNIDLNVSRGAVIASKPSGVAASFNRSADDGAIVDLAQGGTVEGSISVSGTTVSYNAFVGSHYTQLRAGQRQPAVGSVIVSSGQRIRGRTREARAGEKFVYVDLSSTRNQRGVFGVWFGSLNQTAKKMSWGDPNRLVYQVAGLGLYQVLVTDTCGNISNGELLAASPRPGLAERQCGDAGTTYDGRVQDHTLGKALVDVDWSKVQPDRNGVRRALIPAIIMAG